MARCAKWLGWGARTRPALALVLVASMSLAGCQTQVRFHGYVPEEAALAEIEIGRDDREAVARAVGRPGTAGLLRDGAWYFVGSRWEHFAWRAPVEVERELVAISFDANGTVTNIERFGLQDGEAVALSRRVTDTGPRGTGLITQLLRNFGRLSPDALFD